MDGCNTIDLVDAAMRNDQAEIMRFFRDSSVLTVLKCSKDLEKSLQAAASLGFDTLSNYLIIDGSVDVNSVNGRGQTPLHLACSEGHKAVVTVLLSHGANVNARDNHRRTPLMYAATWGLRDIMEILLMSGADINAEDEEGFSAFTVAKNDLARRLLADYSCGLKT